MTSADNPFAPRQDTTLGVNPFAAGNATPPAQASTQAPAQVRTVSYADSQAVSATAGADSADGEDTRSKVAALIFAVIFGAYGAHQFFLGYYKSGIAMILLAVAAGRGESTVAAAVLVVWWVWNVIAIATGKGRYTHDARGRRLA